MFEKVELTMLVIHAYEKADRSGSSIDFEAMYTPSTIRQHYANSYGDSDVLGSGGITKRFQHGSGYNLDLELILDGTDPASKQTVEERVREFLHCVYFPDGSIHRPRYLSVEWGALHFRGEKRFNCVLESVDITYTLFGHDGSPLRAKLSLRLVADEDPEIAKKLANKQSPDLTHLRIVRSGDTLPLLCREIYGDASYYLFVAEANNLDNFRRLTPGQALQFPPLPAA